jgi:hypothetical protein
MNDCITKPVKLAVLLDVIGKWIPAVSSQACHGAAAVSSEACDGGAEEAAERGFAGGAGAGAGDGGG